MAPKYGSHQESHPCSSTHLFNVHFTRNTARKFNLCVHDLKGLIFVPNTQLYAKQKLIRGAAARKNYFP